MSESKELTLELSEESYALINGANEQVAAAGDRRDLILAATFATARIPVAHVLRIEQVGDKKVLFYSVPNGNGKPAEGG